MEMNRTMNNEGMNMNILNMTMDFEKMSPAELDMVADKLHATRLKSLESRLSEVEAQQKINESKNELAFDDVKEQINVTRDIAVASSRANNIPDSYFPQSDFGDMFAVTLSSNRVGKLLKTVGLARRKKKGKTTPYHQYKPKYCKSAIIEDRQIYVWHYKNCLTFIDKWLKKECLYDEFYLNETKRDMEHYIDMLFKKYILDKYDY